MKTQESKRVVFVRKPPPLHWVGDGFPVRSMFSYDDSPERTSPFLLLDYAAPYKFPPSERGARGVGEHPHRGFETVTIAYQGEIAHRDSAGHAGRIGPGDVQWMTAASGVVHEEKHGPELTRKGGALEMVQLWVNLPAGDKRSAPRYQDILDRDIPAATLAGGGGRVRVIAGEFEGAKGPARTFTPINLWDVRLKSGAEFEADLPPGHTAIVLVLRGGVEVKGSEPVGEKELAVFERDGGRLSLKAKEDATLLFLGGEPIDEPVAGYGPFVMNTEAEIGQAVADYRAGLMGHLDEPAHPES